MAQLLTGLQGKTVFITGASSGIGRGIALGFAKQGVELFLTGRSLEELEKTKKAALECSQLNQEQIYLHKADLAIPEECTAAVLKAVEKFGKLDVLVNNAGFAIAGTVETLTLEQYDNQMNVNTRSVFVLTQAALPYLKKTKGNIINISSVSSTRTISGVLAYAVSKSALNHLTKCSARDLAAYGVRCNAISPATIRTPMIQKFIGSEEKTEEWLEQQKQTHALGRVGEVEDVANAVIFLASDVLSGFITGINLSLDGGSGLLCLQ